MTKSEIKIVLVAVGAIWLLNQFDATSNVFNGGNRFFR